MATQHAVESPEWWRDRLWKELTGRHRLFDVWDAYYSGDHPLPWLPEGARDEFRQLLSMTRSNYMGLVVDATAERMEVQGFRFSTDPNAAPASTADLATADDEPDPEATDDEAWRIWQANDLDEEFDAGNLDAVKFGRSFVLVAPNPDDQRTPLITFESPYQAIVACQPGTRRRAAGLKLWTDDWTGRIMATLFLPDEVWKWEAPAKAAGSSGPPAWEQRTVDGEPWPAPNPLGVVPLVEMPNRSRRDPTSEISDLIVIQDRINKTIADRLITQDVGAFPQKWGTGIDLEAEFRPGRLRLWAVEDEGAKFGQFDAAPLDPYSAAKREDVKDIASRSRTPAQYLLGELNNVNGQTLQAAESGLVSKVTQRMRPRSGALETVMRLAFLAAEDTARANAVTAETVWKNPMYRTEGELVDALVKMKTLGVPDEALQQRWGASPQEIKRWRKLNGQAAARVGLGDLASLVGGTGLDAGSGLTVPQ